MSLTPLRQPAAPVQDAPRKLSTPLQTPAHAPGQRPAGANRPSNPALQSVRAGESGFDARTRMGGRPQLGDSRPQFMPAASSFGTASGSQVSGAGAASGVEGVRGPQAAIDRLFTRASRTLENILSGLGYGNLPPAQDSTARLKQASDLLISVLTEDPSKAQQISTGNKAKLWGVTKALKPLQPFMTPVQGDAYQSLGKATMMACGAVWPPPEGNK